MAADGRPEVAILVEDDSRAWGANDSLRKAFLSACVTLSLGCLGSSILPMPYALSKTGILVGALTMMVVAWANDATSCMLIRAAALTGKPTYEDLAEWAGGKAWKVFTQITLLLLLWGTMCGGLALISDVAVIMVQQGFGPDQPVSPWVNGRTCMTAVALLVLYPLCMQRHMRELETAATAGVAMVIVIIGLIGLKAWDAGFPAIKSRELPLWSLQVDEHLPEAFSVVGYAFYMQPMMMPLLREMPPGPGGVKAMEQAVHVVLYGVAFLIYFSMGVFGASLYGQHTEGNIMVNKLVEGKVPTLLLYGTMLLYLSLGMTTTQFALRATLDLVVFGPDGRFTWARQVAMTTLTVGSSLAVALIVPDAAEKIYAVVGATAVCVVCYVIPVYIQLVTYARKRAAAKEAGTEECGQLTAPLLQGELEGPDTALCISPAGPDPAVVQQPACTSPGGWGNGLCNTGATEPGTSQPGFMALLWGPWWEVIHELVLPILILVMGIGFSIAALYVAVKPYL